VNAKKWTSLLLLAGGLLIADRIWSEEPKKGAHAEPKKEAPVKSEKKVEAPAKEASKEKPKEGQKEKALSSNKNDNGLFPEKEVYTKAEVEALREVLEKKSIQLDQDIDAQVKYMESLKCQTEEHLKKIEAARTEIADFMNTRDEKEEGKLKKLARFYEAMDAEQAAPLLKDVNDELAIKIFDRMDAKKAGTILAQLPATRAARLTVAFPKLKLQMDKAQAEATK
jgi:flagellar motility protein MotE (MotC chaperone)